MMRDLFEGLEGPAERRVALAEGAVLLRGEALACEAELLAALTAVTERARLRQMQTPGGFTMSVAMTNCGEVGWVTDRTGYRYTRHDPETGEPWPAMPPAFRELARAAAAHAGYAGYEPDACLINRYVPGARLSLHQDKDERDRSQPIVSVSLGLPASFQFGGLTRSAPTRSYAVRHGDIAVWGGPSRLCYHGVRALEPGQHPILGELRINLTFRVAQ